MAQSSSTCVMPVQPIHGLNETEMDDDSAAFLIELYRVDIEDIRLHTKGKNRATEPNDALLALEFCLRELDASDTCRRDAQIARNLESAVTQDVPILNHIMEQEFPEQRDHDMAVELQREQPTGPVTPGSSKGSSSKTAAATDKESNPDMILKLQTRKFIDLHSLRKPKGVDDAEGMTAESSQWALTRKPPNAEPTSQCAACQEEKPWFDVDQAPCGDPYCVDCLTSLFQASMTDESLYPPRCCGQAFSFQRVQKFIRPDVSLAFDNKRLELDTKDRTYCFAPDCATFVPPGNIVGDVATCPSCSRLICITCKGAAHRGDCPKDTALQTLIATANEEGWQRCYSCRRMVELDVGCNHMTCICRAQFCYVCGEQWKTCECPTWEEQRLYDRASRIANRANNVRRRLFNPPEGNVIEELAIPDIDEPVVEEPVVDEPVLPLMAIEAQPIEVPDPVPEAPEEEGLAPVPAPALASTRVSRAAELDARTREAKDERLLDPHPPEPEQPVMEGLRKGTRRTMADIVRNLRKNHECVHRNWFFLEGPHRCEECSHFLPRYIFECRQCELQACWRCRKNRL